MLELLFLHKRKTLIKDMFLNHIYGDLDEPVFKITDVFICKLLQKLCEVSDEDNNIENVWGRWYVFKDPMTGIEQSHQFSVATG